MTIPYKQHYKALFQLGIPIIIGQVFIIILGFADTMMVGRHSATELSAAGFVVNVFNLIILAGLGFSFGLTPVVGEFFGRGEYPKAGGSLKHSLLANFIVALLMMAVMFIVYLFLPRLGQPEELLPLIRPFYLIIWSSLPLTMLFNAFKQFSEGVTDTRTPMWILLTGNLLNILFNYLLIYGAWGFPELGLVGAGLATLIARAVMVVVAAALFIGAKRYRPYLEGFKQTRLNRKEYVQLNRLGFPVALQLGMEKAAFSLTAIMMGWISAAALAAHQVVTTISCICFLVYYGMGAAVAVRVSNFCGQGDYANVRRTAYAGFHLIVVLGLITSSFVFLFREPLCGCFTDSEEVTSIAVALILSMMLYQVGDGTQSCFANALRGISDVKALMYMAFISYIVISLPLSYLFGFVMKGGALGIWMAFPVSLTAAGVMYFWRFRRIS